MEDDIIKPLLLNKIEDYPLSGLGRITTATNQDVHELINGDYTYTFDMLVTDKLFSKVKEEMIVSTSVSVSGTDLFYIKNIGVKSPGVLTVTCNHITMLTNENYVRDKLTIDGKSVKAIVQEMSDRLDLKQNFSYSTDIDKTIGKTDIVYTNSNPGQILVGDNNSLVSVLDARLVRKGMTLKLTNKTTGRYMDLRRGKNIAGVSISSTTDNLVTSIVPFFTVKPSETKDDKDSDDSTSDGWVVREVKSGGTVTVGDEPAVTYNTANVADKGRELAPKSVWKTTRQRTKGDVVQYNVATDMWVDSKSVTLNGEVGDVIKSSTNPSSADNWTVKKISSGIVTVNSGGSTIYDDSGNAVKSRMFASGSKWATDRQRTKDGVVQYRVATNQWVPASMVSFEGKVSDSTINNVPTLPVNNDGWTIRRLSSDSIAKVTSNGATVYDNSDKAEIGRKLAPDSIWYSDQSRTGNGVTEYRVATNQWLRSDEVTFTGSVGSVISQPAAVQRTFMMARAIINDSNWTYRRAVGTVTIGSENMIYNDAGKSGNRGLATGSSWKVDRARTNGGQTQYRVGTDQWVSSSGNTFKGDIYEIISTPGNKVAHDDYWIIKSVSGTVNVTNPDGATIYDESNVSQRNRRLAKDSKWKTTKQRVHNNTIEYNVANNMWVNGNDVTLDGTIGVTISQPSIDSNDGWTYITVKNGIVTTKSDGAIIYFNDNSKALNRKLAPKTPWKTDMRRSKDGVFEYRVATNMWVLADDVDFKGELGSQTSNDSEVSSASGSTEEYNVYGPEVYSPLVNDYKGPHRKYVDYSSRVVNIGDLIDLSNRYSFENPKIDMPTYTIDIEVAKANQKRVVNAQVGDIARIYDPNYGITSDETIVERHFDPDLGINKSLKAGTVQQTIFRYLDKRIKDASQKAGDVKKQVTNDISGVKNNIDSVTNDIVDVKNDSVATKDETKKEIDKSEQQAQEQINSVKNTVTKTQTDMTNLMNSGGNNKIQWLPNFANATQLKIITPYGYWLLDDHGGGFHSNDGTVMNGLSADGRVYADSITGNSLTGTTITGGTINGGVLNAPVINSAKIEGAVSIRLLNNGKVSTSIAEYGISTPNITVNQIDGANLIQTHALKVSGTATIQYLHVSGNIAGDSGVYIQGPLYVDGRQI